MIFKYSKVRTLSTLEEILYGDYIMKHLTEENFQNKPNYYMAVSHKDWELPNSRISLAEIDIGSSLDFPI